MMFPFSSVHRYTSPPDSYFPLTEIPSLAIGDSNQLKSLCTSASSQAAQPYKALLPCLSFHCFTCCCPSPNQQVLTVPSLPCKVCAPGAIIHNHGICQHHDFIDVLSTLNTFLGTSSPFVTVIWENLNFLL